MQRQQPPSQQRQPQDPNGSRTSSATFSATSFTSSVTTSSSSSTPLSSSVSFQDNLLPAKPKRGASLIRRPNSFPLVAEALSPPIIPASNNIASDDPDNDVQMAPSCNKLPHTLARPQVTAAPVAQGTSLPSHDRDASLNNNIIAGLPAALPSHDRDAPIHHSTNAIAPTPSAPSHDTDSQPAQIFQSPQQLQHPHSASAFQPPKHPNIPTVPAQMVHRSSSGSNYSLRQSRSDAIHTSATTRTEQQYHHDNDTDRSSRSSSNFRLSLSLSQSRSGTIDSFDEALRSDRFSGSHRSGSDSSIPSIHPPTSISTSSSSLSSAPSPSTPQHTQPPQAFNLSAVTAAQLGTFLTVFEDMNVANQPEAQALVSVRRLLDVLDFLTDKMALPVCERLYTALSSTTCIRALISLLSDTNVRAKRRVTFEVLKQFRYPYVVATILSSPKIADAILCVPELLHALLSILERPQCHPIVAAHTVNLLVTYLEYNPSPLLNVLENEGNGNTLKHIATHLHHAPVVDLVAALLPSNGAHGHFFPSEQNGLYPKKGLRFLANSRCLHVFAHTFKEAAVKAADAYAVGSMVATAHHNLNQMHHASHVPQQHVSQMYHEELQEEPVEEESVRRAVYNAELKANNAIAAYLAVIEHTVRKVRVDRNSSECMYLNVYSTPSTAETVGSILDTGVKCYKRSNGQCADFLIAAITATTKILETVEKDATKRVASTAGQPPKIQLGLLAFEIKNRLSDLIMLATQKGIGLSKTAARIRMYTLELLGTVQRVCGAYDEEKMDSEEKINANAIFALLDKLRFGEVAMKMIVLHSGHSMLHTCVLKAVETALLADSANEYSRRHWLKRSKLTWNIMKLWKKEHMAHISGGRRFREEVASVLVHLACIVHHWIACTHAKCKPGEIAEARTILGEEGIKAFNEFFEDTVKGRIEKEKGGIEKPTRPRLGARGGMGMLSASTSSGANGIVSAVGGITISSNGSGIGSSKNGVHLVRSPSAHRFGYSEPNAAKRPRNRFAELFDRADEDGAGNNDFGTNRDDAFARIRAAAEARHNNNNNNNNNINSSGGGIGALRRSRGFEEGEGDEESKDELFD